MKFARTSTKSRPSSLAVDPEPAGGVRVRYLESSTVVAAVLDGERDAIQNLRGEGHRVASALTFAEARRAIVRARATNRISAAEERSALGRLGRFENRVDIIAIDDTVLKRLSRRFPVEPVRAMDGIHLATAEMLDESPQFVTIVTRDRRVRANAVALGFTVE
jgi:predicted nucleic acid-binding protein